MSKVKAKTPDWLTREQIDQIVACLSADDIIDSGFTDAGEDKSKVMKAAKVAFNSAAGSAGLNGEVPASKRIKVGDLQYWTTAITGAINVDSPLSEGQEA